MAIKHNFICNLPDGVNQDMVKPSNWIEDHVGHDQQLHIDLGIETISGSQAKVNSHESTYNHLLLHSNSSDHTQNTDTNTNAVNFSINGSNAIKEGDNRLTNARTPTTHSHPESEITNLVTDLALKEPINANIQTHISSAHAPSDAQKNSDITKGEIETKLIGVISSHSHSGGGSDPWTYIFLTSDFVTSSSTTVPVTGMEFTPLANKKYEIYGMFMMRTNSTTVGPRPGCEWPTGLIDGVATIKMTSSATAQLIANGNINAAVLSSVGGLPNTTQSYPAKIEAMFISGATPSGTFKIRLASETSGTNVTMKANSFLKYREI